MYECMNSSPRRTLGSSRRLISDTPYHPIGFAGTTATFHFIGPEQ